MWEFRTGSKFGGGVAGPHTTSEARDAEPISHWFDDVADHEPNMGETEPRDVIRQTPQLTYPKREGHVQGYNVRDATVPGGLRDAS